MRARTRHVYTERRARGAICFEYTFPVFLAELLSTNCAWRGLRGRPGAV